MPTANLVLPDILEKLHIEAVNSGACHGDWIAQPTGGELISLCPATGEPLARVRMAGAATHAEENASDQPADRIAVELK